MVDVQSWLEGYYVGKSQILDETIERLKKVDEGLSSNLESAKRVEKAADSLLKETRGRFLGIF